MTMLTRIDCQRRSSPSPYILELYIWKKEFTTQVLSDRLVQLVQKSRRFCRILYSREIISHNGTLWTSTVYIYIHCIETTKNEGDKFPLSTNSFLDYTSALLTKYDWPRHLLRESLFNHTQFYSSDWIMGRLSQEK